jgi:N-sulfoglucosamine sulfohydrolase
MAKHSRRDVMRIGALSAALPALSAGRAAARKQDRPNILLVVPDGLSVPHMGCYGNSEVKTPNLDRFAAQGIRFDRAYTTCPQCIPARAALMTGRSPVGIRMTRHNAPLPMEVRTFAEWLRGQSYFTGIAGRSFHLDGEPACEAMTDPRDKYDLRTFKRRVDYLSSPEWPDRATQIAQFVEFFDRLPKGSPFFFKWCTADSHPPYLAGAIPEPHDPAKITLPPHYPDTQLVRQEFARYYDLISRFDSDFGHVLTILEERGLAQNTLVAVTSDHGVSLLRGKGTLYELGINVPLLVRWPGKIKPGRVSSELISHEDVAPTFLEAAGIVPPKEMTGRSFLKLLRGEPFEGRKYVFAERGSHARNLPTSTAYFDLSRSIVGRNCKLIYNALWQLPYAPVDFNIHALWRELEDMNREGRLSSELSRAYFTAPRPMFELYERNKDPREFNNLAGRPEFAEVEWELKSALYEWMLLEWDYAPLPIPYRCEVSRPTEKK